MKLPFVLRQTAERDVAALRDTLAQAQTALEDLGASQAAALGDRDRVALALAQRDAECARLAAQIDEIERARVALEDKREALAHMLELKSAEHALMLAHAEERYAAEQALRAAEAKVAADAQAALEETRQALARTEGELNSARAEANGAAEAREALARSSGELEATRAALAGLQAANTDTLTLIQKLQAELAALSVENGRVSTEKAALEAALAESRANHDLASLHLDQYKAETARLGAETLRLEALRTPDALARFRNRQEAIAALRANGARARLLAALSLTPEGLRDRKAIFALHKTASMFVWRLLDMTSDVLGVELHSPNGADAEYILDEISLKHTNMDWRSQYGLFGPFRGHVALDWNLFSHCVVITRDPRDLLVSMYFSWSQSHPVSSESPNLVSPAGELFSPSAEQRQRWIDDGPDPFVLDYADFVETNLRALLQEVMPNMNAVLLRYEDFIASPHDWIRSFFEALGCTQEDIAAFMPYILREFGSEFVPPHEDPASHRRQMLPGDYQRKLKDETIATLTKKFAFYFESIQPSA